MEVHRVFGALSCRWRVEIVKMIGSGTICQCEIVKALPLDETTLSRHLKILKDAGIVSEWREGRKKMLKLRDQMVLKIIEMAEKMGEGF